jgi:AraC family transcriptional activator of pyochelin receptor
MDAVEIEISAGLRLVLGRPPRRAEPGRVALLFDLGGEGRGPSLRLFDAAGLPASAAPSGAGVSLLIEAATWRRLGGAAPGEADARGYHLHGELRAIAVALVDGTLGDGALRDGAMPSGALRAWRAAKGVELLCETIRLGPAARAVPIAGTGAGAEAGAGLNMADAARILAARRMIDERWREPLSLAAIGRACGVNRAKLTRGFRGMFDCSIAEALAERRLTEARRMLAVTDLPVALVGYENGYLNKASFARAFSRRFGAPPSAWRAASHGRAGHSLTSEDLAA